MERFRGNGLLQKGCEAFKEENEPSDNQRKKMRPVHLNKPPMPL